MIISEWVIDSEIHSSCPVYMLCLFSSKIDLNITYICGGRGLGLRCRVGRGGKSRGNGEQCGIVTHDFVVEARETITFVVLNVCVLVGKVKVTKDLTCVLSSESKEGELVKVGAQVLCRINRVTSLECYMEIVMGNVDVCSLPTAVVS